jgi:hypothetical protein
MEKRYVQNSHAISGRLQDELVMMDTDKGKYFALNPVATRIWDLLEQPLSVDELCGSLLDEYDVEPEKCHSEVVKYLDQMEKLGLVIVIK